MRGSEGGREGWRETRTDGQTDGETDGWSEEGNSIDSIFEVPAKVIIFPKE